MEDDWLEDFERIADASAKGERTDATQRAIESLDERLRVMEANPRSVSMSNREMKRRRALVDKLKAEQHMQSKPVVYGGGTFVRPDVADPSPYSSSGRSLVTEHRQMIAEQDVIVDEIGRGVDRLHDRALNIHDETNLHKSLLDDMDLDVEAVNANLKKETHHAIQIRKRSGNCYLYICIVVLLFILILLIILGFQH